MIIRSLWNLYLGGLEKHPIKTKMATGMLITSAGDLIAQKLVEGNDDVDLKRLANMAMYGCLVAGGVGHYWYKGLDHAFGSKMTLRSSLKKMGVDLLLFAPPETAFFMAWAHLGSDSKEPVMEKLKKDYKSVLIADYILWVPTQFVNFCLVPERHRVLFQSVVMVFWSTFISFASHNSLDNLSFI